MEILKPEETRQAESAEATDRNRKLCIKLKIYNVINNNIIMYG